MSSTTFSLALSTTTQTTTNRSLHQKIRQSILDNRFSRRKHLLRHITFQNMNLFKRINSQKSIYRLSQVKQEITNQENGSRVTTIRSRCLSANTFKTVPEAFRSIPSHTHTEPMKELRIYTHSVTENKEEKKLIVVQTSMRKSSQKKIDANGLFNAKKRVREENKENQMVKMVSLNEKIDRAMGATQGRWKNSNERGLLCILRRGETKIF